jgi:hypothetical protein
LLVMSVCDEIARYLDMGLETGVLRNLVKQRRSGG